MVIRAYYRESNKLALTLRYADGLWEETILTPEGRNTLVPWLTQDVPWDAAGGPEYHQVCEDLYERFAMFITTSPGD